MIEAEHTCMTLRGIKAHGATTITTQYSGTFREDSGEHSRRDNGSRRARKRDTE